MIRRWTLVTLALFVLIVTLEPPATAQVRLQDSQWIATGEQAWQAGQLHGLTATVTGHLVLSSTAPEPPQALSSHRRYGLFDSPIRSTTPFRRVHVNYQARVPQQAELLLMVRASKDGRHWTEWEMAQPNQIVIFDRVAHHIQYRAVLLGDAASPSLAAVTLTPLPLTDNDRVIRKLHDPVAPTYRIRATREGLVGNHTANGHLVTPMDRFVSLPSWRSLSSLGGWEYSVRITNPANGRSAVAPVWDVGPWNHHDDYWNENRQRYADLRVGWPEDHAAYYHGYNGGRAELGRVLWPAALDVGDGTWVEDLGIAFNNEQATVLITFLWQGEDPGPNPTPIETYPLRRGEAPPAPRPQPEAHGNGVVVDNLSPGFDPNQAIWYEEPCGYKGHTYWTYTTNIPKDSENVASWRPTLPETRQYDLNAYIPYCINGEADTREARYEVHHSGGVDVVSLSQAAKAGNWAKLGRWSFAAGDSGFVRLSDIAGDRMRSLWYDAIEWVPVE